MNICILINSFNLGGAEKLMYDVAQELHTKGENVVLVAMKKAETELEITIKNKLENTGLTVDSIDKPVNKGKIRSVIKIRSLLKKYKIDVLHTNGQSPDFYGRIASFSVSRVKNVVTIHSTSSYSRRIEKILQKTTDAYTAVSKQAIQYAEHTLGIQDVKLIENGINFIRYENKKMAIPTQMILSVGRVTPEKGYQDIMQSMCDYLLMNDNAEWHILGEISQNKEFFSELKSMIDDRVKDRIVFEGAVTNPEDYYKAADLFLLPSRYEGFGIAYIEAMAAKLPVIANKVGVMIDIDDAGGTFVEVSGKSISECIQEAMSITDKQKEFNYKLCKDNYSLEVIAEQYREIYYSLKRKCK